MRWQLPKLLVIFSYIPSWISLIAFAFLLLLCVDASGRGNSLITVTYGVLALTALVFLIGKIVAEHKLEQFKTGTNPVFIVSKYPNNLESQIAELEKAKYVVKQRDGKTALLERKPDFHWLDAIVFFLLGILPGILYIVWYFTQKPKTIFLDLNTQKG